MPLTSGRINLLKPYFRIINYRYFNVLSSANLLIKSGLLKSFLLWADYLLIRFIPGFKLLGRAVVIELRQPIKIPQPYLKPDGAEGEVVSPAGLVVSTVRLSTHIVWSTGEPSPIHGAIKN